MSMQPTFFPEVRRGAEVFGHSIGTVVNTALLLIVYVLGVGITAAIARFSGKQFLNLTFNKDSKSYWQDLHLKKKETREYYRQF